MAPRTFPPGPTRLLGRPPPPPTSRSRTTVPGCLVLERGKMPRRPLTIYRGNGSFGGPPVAPVAFMPNPSAKTTDA